MDRSRFEKYIPRSAHHYRLRPGDFVSIPTDTYHLFRNLGPSRFLGLSLYPTTAKKAVTEAMVAAVARGVDGVPVWSPGEVPEHIRETLSRHRDLESLCDALSQDVLRVNEVRRTYGYGAAPHDSVLPDDGVPSSAALERAYDGVLACIDTPAGTELLMRGRSRAPERHIGFGDLVAMSASPRPLSAADIRAALPGALRDDERDTLVAGLYRYGAVVHAGTSAARRTLRG